MAQCFQGLTSSHQLPHYPNQPAIIPTRNVFNSRHFVSMLLLWPLSACLHPAQLSCEHPRKCSLSFLSALREARALHHLQAAPGARSSCTSCPDPLLQALHTTDVRYRPEAFPTLRPSSLFSLCLGLLQTPAGHSHTPPRYF